MRLLGQFQPRLFLLRKDFKRTKTEIKPKPTNKTKISEQKTTKAISVRAQKFLRGENCLFWVLVLFLRSKFFCQKKKKTKKNGIYMIVTINSFTILLMCIHISPPIENLFSHAYVHDKSAGLFYIIICQNLYACISTCVSYLSGFICTHLYECSNIKSIDILFVEDTAT